MSDKQIIELAKTLMKVLKLKKKIDASISDNFPTQIAEIIKTSATGAAASAVASGWIPGAGSAIAATISAGFIWTMYGRINNACGIPLGESIIKSLASGVATNLLSYIAGGLVVSAVVSFFPGLGTAAAIAVIASTCYALTTVSGILYIKLLTSLLNEGVDPTGLNDAELKQRTDNIIKTEDVKSMLVSSKEMYKK